MNGAEVNEVIVAAVARKAAKDEAHRRRDWAKTSQTHHRLSRTASLAESGGTQIT
jgi:hypothetical protein